MSHSYFRSGLLDRNGFLFFCSFGDVSGATIMGDAGMLGVGFSIVFIYVIANLGQFNMVEQRVRPFRNS
jgi:hypothetical protein